MARLVTSGAEWKEATPELNATGASAGFATANATFSTVSPISGNVSFLNGSATWAVCSTAGTLGVTLGHTAYVRASFQIDAYPANAIPLFTFSDSSNALYGSSSQLILNTNGTLNLNGGSVTSAAIPLNTPVTIEVSLNIGTGSVDAIAWRLNGVLQESRTGLNLGDNAISYLQISAASGSSLIPNFQYDDIAINDDTGTAQNTWPGTGKVVLLVPASDNAKGTGWTNDAASSTSLFPSVDNKPPAGIADTTGGSGLHQIRNATSNANVNYDANLSTYTAAGIGASDTVNVALPMVATGAPVTTSSKQGTYGISANPVIANVALGASGTAGAFWQGNAAGTYPTGWKWSIGTTAYAPAVTVGTAPVARITQVTASTRIAMVCAMGMYVDYTPGVSALPPLPVYVDSAVARSTSY